MVQQPPGGRCRRRRPAAPVALAAAMCALGVGSARAAVSDYVGRPVVEVRLELEGRVVDDPSLAELVETRVGAPLAMDQVRESALHLFSLGRFRDVHVDATRRGDGVALRYLLFPLRAVARLAFRGALGLPEGQLRRAVVERYGPAPSIGRAADAARTLEELYRAHGYMRARVQPVAVDEPASDRTTLLFEVDAGQPARIGSLELTGIPAASKGEALERLGVGPGDRYERERIEQRLARYADDLRQRGYYEAEAAHAVQLRDEGRAVDLLVEVRPGPHVTVVFEGDPLPADRLAELVPIAREGSVDEDLLEDSSRRIAGHLRSQGYWRAAVEHTRQQTDGELRVVFTVRKGRQYRVGGMQVSGNASVPLAELEPLLRLRPGLPFVESTFDADVAAIGERYRRLGYDAVRVDSAVEEVAESTGAGREAGAALARLRISIVERTRTLVGSVTLAGHRAFTESELRAVMGSVPGQPYYRPQVAADRDAVRLLYLNDGYQTASVDVDVRFSEDRASADLGFRIAEGPQILVDHVLIVGNTRTSAATIRRELALVPGQPLGLDDLVESQRRLSALGLFRRIRITEVDHGAGTRRDILVAVEEAPATNIGYGGGLEAGQRLRRADGSGGQAVERLEFAPRGFFEIGRRNLWGKNRSIDLFTRISVRPKDEPDDPTREGRGLGFSEYRVLGTYREPRAFGWDADVFITGFLEQAIRSSFNLNRRGVLAELRRQLTSSVSLSGRYSYNQNRLFDERFNPEDQPLIDRLFPEITLSSVSSSLIQDTRDDALDPSRGGFVSLNGEIAARAVRSEVGFAKSLTQGFVYRRLPGPRRIILAAGARLGLATGFPRDVAQTDAAGRPLAAPDGSPLVTTVRDLPASERFFAGGDTTVRGFALDRLGDAPTIDQDGFPKGGHALVVLNAELRVPVWREIGAVAFLDAGNVYATVGDLSLGNLRGGAGFGVRYGSPIGPIRVDLGFKLDRRRFASGERERLTALHISIGQAF